ncbi:hypothetical protein BCR36DRAFT_408743 [Piromyces finnis]|uniref:Uncharacterized protein n=1 Tax=Piromyces finnis TaxID=1754191 RepID=A0A1Y1VLA2_9FUNG|nr:hypothetical protein BCR36DRAFT_408743 [Piromyces finnis]|eukprot:ORX59238.1 hypothetical protein BCR36DRAFT_408743 [Piromyces finnis]
MSSKDKDLDISDEKSIQNAICNFCYVISSHTHINNVIGCILVFIEDIQMLYFVFNESVIQKLPNVLQYPIKFIAFDNFDYSIMTRILTFSMTFLFIITLHNLLHMSFKFILQKDVFSKNVSDTTNFESSYSLW